MIKKVFESKVQNICVCRCLEPMGMDYASFAVSFPR